MTVSMRVMSAGDGYKYLLKSFAAGDGDRSLSTPLTRYYAEAVTPPGFWMGSGLGRLGHGELVEGAPVSEAQLALLVGMGHDPITGEPLGRAYQQFASISERIKQRVYALDHELRPATRAQEVAAIEAEEAERGTRRAVAGYDFTFSVPKSVSTIWSVADAGTQALIADAHHAAVAELIEFIEREVAATRVGATGPDGAVAHVDVAGVVAAAFDHYDGRAGDPQLHTHVVISNKVLTVRDGRWRTLAGRPMHAVVVAVSELYNAALADQLTRALGVEWEARERGRDRNPAWEIEAVPDELVAEFSTRSRHIEAEKDRLIAEYVAKHGRQPSARTVLKLRALATLATRPEKTDELPGVEATIDDWVNPLPGVWTVERLVSEAGLSERLAQRALTARTTAELNELLDDAPEAQGLVLLDLAHGKDLQVILDELGLGPVPPEKAAADEDEQLIEAFEKSRGGFVFVGGGAPTSCGTHWTRCPSIAGGSSCTQTSVSM